MTPRRTDRNQSAIVAALRKAGRRVQDAHTIGQGFPDLVCCCPSGRVVLLEVKAPNGVLNERELRWHAEWAGAPVFIVRSIEEALEVTG